MNAVDLVAKQVKSIIDLLEKDLFISPNIELVNVSRVQKEACKKKLQQIYDILVSESLPDKKNRDLGLAHTIVDSWPFDTKIGEKIINVEKAYIELPD